MQNIFYVSLVTEQNLESMNNGKAKVENAIRIPSKKNWFALLFGTVWLESWYFGFKSPINNFIFGELGGFDGFMTFWLIGGIMVFSILLWRYFGKEKIEFNQKRLNLKKRLDQKEVKKQNVNSIL